MPHFRDPEDVARYAEAFKQLLEVAATGEDSADHYGDPGHLTAHVPIGQVAGVDEF